MNLFLASASKARFRLAGPINVALGLTPVAVTTFGADKGTLAKPEVPFTVATVVVRAVDCEEIVMD